jgi:hypothetical protein
LPYDASGLSLRDTQLGRALAWYLSPNDKALSRNEKPILTRAPRLRIKTSRVYTHDRYPDRHRRRLSGRQHLHGVRLERMNKKSERCDVPIGYARDIEKRVTPRIDRQDIALMLVVAVLAVVLGAAAIWIALY